MALNICMELVYRLIFTLFKYFIENWFFVLLIILLVSWLTKKVSPLILMVIASLMNISIDVLFGATFGTSSIASGIISVAVGFLWATVILFSSAPVIIKVINMPLMFIIGLIWGILPIPIPIDLVIAFLLRFRITNYLVAVLPSILIIIFLFFAGPTLCSLFNDVTIYLS